MEPEREAAPIEEQGIGWKSSFGTGKGDDTIGCGVEVTRTSTPTKWAMGFFHNLFDCKWELTRSPAGAHQRQPKQGASTVSYAHDPSKRPAPSMMTTYLSRWFDPAYEKISPHFMEHPDEFADTFARAWFKLTHRNMGPCSRYLGADVPPKSSSVRSPYRPSIISWSVQGTSTP